MAKIAIWLHKLLLEEINEGEVHSKLPCGTTVTENPQLPVPPLALNGHTFYLILHINCWIQMTPNLEVYIYQNWNEKLWVILIASVSAWNERTLLKIIEPFFNDARLFRRFILAAISNSLTVLPLRLEIMLTFDCILKIPQWFSKVSEISKFQYFTELSSASLSWSHHNQRLMRECSVITILLPLQRTILNLMIRNITIDSAL